ncbi:hypothetical protein EVAR_7518_1 [Eumeta japonica]|uniref:Uncharacterized protein n=1 Tax=Eumeta variegata TaxID=151549 RepID=A0A4C2AA91_EUMVA|nr:hypothetical protein EVAR_7518_1 [Eumeta japonica]
MKKKMVFTPGRETTRNSRRPADTSTTISKWDAAERHQSSRRPPHELVVRTRHDVALGRRARHIGSPYGGAPESVVLSTTLPEVIGEALTRAPVCRPEEHVVVRARCSAAGAPDQEVVRREAPASAGSTSTSVNGLELTMCSASAAGCGELLREGSSLNVAANAVLIDRTKRPRRHPCSERREFFVCADEIRAVVRIHHLGVPLRAMNRRKASIMESDDKDSASSMYGACCQACE